MTAIITKLTFQVVGSRSSLQFVQAAGVVVLIVLLIQRELLRFLTEPRSKQERMLNTVILPLLLMFVLVMTVRFLDLL